MKETKRRETVQNECSYMITPFGDGQKYCALDYDGGKSRCYATYCDDYTPRKVGQHFVKICDVYFEELIAGKKPFEFRMNDRDYRVGDYVCMQEQRQKSDGRTAYTGRYIVVQIKALWPLVELSEALAEYVIFTFEIISVYLRQSLEV